MVSAGIADPSSTSLDETLMMLIWLNLTICVVWARVSGGVSGPSSVSETVLMEIGLSLLPRTGWSTALTVSPCSAETSASVEDKHLQL